MSGDYTVLQYDVQDGVAHIMLNRPDAANSFDVTLARELFETSLRCGGDRGVRAVAITGAGRTFSAGGDLRSFQAQGERMPMYLEEVTTYLHAAVSHFARMDAPVIAGVHGSAAGAGMSLACACDLVIAAESARFVMAYTRIGVTPDGSASYVLPRLVGMQRAMELVLTNRTLSAQEALAWGIATRVVPDAELMVQTMELARQLARGPTVAFGAAKRLLHAGWTETLETQMAQETRTIAAMARTVDGREGIRAFLEKRPPEFEGQ